MHYIIGTFLLIASGLLIEAEYNKHESCIFPFKYNGKLYDDCITSDASAPWCSADEVYRGIFHYCNNNAGEALESNGAFLSAQRKLAENSAILRNSTYFTGGACENCGTELFIVSSSMEQLGKISNDNDRHLDYLLNVENVNFKDSIQTNFEDIKQYLVCPSGWFRLSDSECFHFGPNKNFDEGIRYCESKGAQLASVNNLAENELIRIKAKHLYESEGSFFIGLTDRDHEGKWEWAEENDSTFTNWNQGEPNGSQAENCVMVYLSNGKWNDIPCHVKGNTVCRGHILYAKQ